MFLVGLPFLFSEGAGALKQSKRRGPRAMRPAPWRDVTTGTAVCRAAPPPTVPAVRVGRAMT